RHEDSALVCWVHPSENDRSPQSEKAGDEYAPLNTVALSFASYLNKFYRRSLFPHGSQVV
ncbi:MAG TPA: hypothetical protein VG146_08560, partial [Verrucomicrobiae bacterium]|nr:hypothetical protein [Verrucomicrobiae bacterium]